MDQSDTVLVVIIVSIIVLAIGGISTLVILLVVKWRDYLKRSHHTRLTVAPLIRNNSRNNGGRSRQRRIRNGDNPVQSAEEPPPYTEIENNPPPTYAPVDVSSSQIRSDDETIAYSPPPPYTVLPPRTLITRENTTRDAFNSSRPGSFRPLGTRTANTPLLTPAGITLFGHSRQPTREASSAATRSRERSAASHCPVDTSILHV